MARLWQSGFELNLTTAGTEWTTVTGSTIQTSTVRTGVYAGQVTSLVTATAQGFAYQFVSAAGAGPYFFRFYLRIAALPSAANRICSLNNTTGLTGTSEASLKLDNTGALTLFNGLTQVGSASSALSLNTWYAIEIKFNSAGGVGAGILEARINQSVFATASNLTIAAGVLEYVIGANLLLEAQTTGNWFLDDIAVNDSTGSSQTTYPGSGNIIHYWPSAAGDSTGFSIGGSSPAASNFQSVNEHPLPDDGVTFVDALTSGVTDMYKIVSDSSLGARDTINTVAVVTRPQRAGVGPSTFKVQIESQPSGTILQSVALSSAGGFVTDWSATIPVPIMSYTDPQAGGSWTKALIDKSQIGYILSTTGSAAVNISTIWTSIDFTPSGVNTNLLSILGTG